MPTLDPSKFKHNSKIFQKNCLWCGTVYYASRSTAKYCSNTCRAYAHQANHLDEAAPWDESQRTVSALLAEIVYLKGQLEHYMQENEALRQQLEKSV